MNGSSDDARQLVTALIEAADALSRAAGEIERLRSTVASSASFWRRLLCRQYPGLDRLSAALSGLQMSERRIERLMTDVGIERIASVGRPFDPETMEAIEVVTVAEQPPGTVLEELRRGYLWRGRVFRFAQVRVAK
jgi:molecular chaperone GrpE